MYIYKENQETHRLRRRYWKFRVKKIAGWRSRHFSKDSCRIPRQSLAHCWERHHSFGRHWFYGPYDNVIVIRKGFGDTRLLCRWIRKFSCKSILQGAKLSASSIHKLRNETISLTTPDYKQARSGVKIVLDFLGSMEVVESESKLFSYSPLLLSLSYLSSSVYFSIFLISLGRAL